MTRNLTRVEAMEFIDTCLNIAPVECADNGKAFEVAEIDLERDTVEMELQMFAADNEISLNIEGVKYHSDMMDDAPIDILVVTIPYGNG